ncbi:peptidase E [Cellulosimicrobium cellulans]|uniref:Type 1 glutamine amidotransferase-like domain-containing protein n=1 Tax=Cellulosimicrobium cellulans TaxID=1710 RepID=UPI000848A591|nr:peptidase E [Cellulosimicrobium cellulans]
MRGLTILATSGGYAPGRRTRLALGPLVHHAADLSGVDGTPRVCHVGTAGGDQSWFRADLDEAARVAGVRMSHLSLFSMPNVEDVEGHLRAHDVVWVGGGSVVNLLAVWRAHGLPAVLRSVGEAGVVLAGISAGSLCWHVGGPTDSFGPELRPMTDGLAFVPYGNGVHHDSDPGRRPLLHRMVAEGTLPTSYATDDGVGLVYQGGRLAGAVTERRGAAAWEVRRTRGPDGETVVDEGRIEPTALRGAR